MKDLLWLDEITSKDGSNIATYSFSKYGHVGCIVLYSDKDGAADSIVKILKAFNENEHDQS